jgi:NitT/TauT family transport system ATP-binding protein
VTGSLLLSACSLTFGYRPGNAVLNGLEFEIDWASRIALMGPSGVGKSTLLKLIAGMFPPASGSISVQLPGARSEGKRTGYVSQESTLLPWLTVKRSIEFTHKLVSGSSRTSGLPVDDEVLADLGLNGHLGALPYQLSGGLAKRAALAACLLSGANLFLLDEPFTGSDLRRRQIMYSAIRRVHDGNGAGLIFTTHDAIDAVELADTVIWLGGPNSTDTVVIDASAGWTERLKSSLSRLLLGIGSDAFSA